ncbi:hypothetical protein ABEW34_17065 [Paenibacillus algorifonticola]|uniref:hypothetical protein n=1 Tax=Paenibacillus algorifonticola TaxID=684063 RepID=UPI003D2AA52A
MATNGIINMDELDGEVVAECTQQLVGSGLFIYNAHHPNASLIVENLGFGDVYVSDREDVSVGADSMRLLFREQLAIRANKLFFTSNSQPVVSIIEVM